MAITAHGSMGDRTNPLLVGSATGTFDLRWPSCRAPSPARPC